MSHKRMKLNETGLKDVSDLSAAENPENPLENEELSVDPAPVNFSVTFELEFWEKFWKIEQELSAELDRIDFTKDKNISAIYNPLEYAADVHKNFMRKYLVKAPKVLFLGMNPGLYGMCQTSASDSMLLF